MEPMIIAIVAGAVLVAAIVAIALVTALGHGRQSGKKPPIAQPITVEPRQRTIVCPICYEEFKPEQVKFKFSIKGAPVYLSADDTNNETQTILRNNAYRAEVDRTNGIPTVMRLKDRNTGYNVMASSYRVCGGGDRDELSTNAGKYSPENGLFLLGMKSSGKTVYITTAINRLNDILPRKYGCTFRAYNADVAANYLEKYYGVLYKEHVLPAATIEATAQLPYEVTNIRTGKIAGVTFSDIKGEIAVNANVATESAQLTKAAAYSNYVLVTVDIKAMTEDEAQAQKTMDIFNFVIPNVIVGEKGKKYLAIVLTKSDELVGMTEAFNEQSKIYAPVAYDDEGFDEQRREINEKLKRFIMAYYPAIAVAAEGAFGEDHVNYFAVSALGKPPVDGKCEIIAPIRVEEPVLWLLKKSGIFNNARDGRCEL